MQILLRVVPPFANYQVWWSYRIGISFCKKLYMNSSFVTTFFFFSIFSFCQNNLRILRFKLSEVVAVKHFSDINNRKV